MAKTTETKSYASLYCGDIAEDVDAREMIANGWAMTAHEHPENFKNIVAICVGGIENTGRIHNGYLYSNGSCVGGLATIRFWKYA